MERGHPERQKEFLNLAVGAFQKTLALDSENVTAHYTLSLIYSQLGDEAKAAYHRQEHEKYLPDYNAQDRAISIARRANPPPTTPPRPPSSIRCSDRARRSWMAQ